MKNERRKEKRIYPSRTLQLIFGCGKQVIGRIHSISSGGVSVEYQGQCPPQDMVKAVTIKMALDMQSSLILEEITCRPVYDIPTLAHDWSFRGADLRLRGLRYDYLSPANQLKLRRLLDAVA